MKNLQKITSIFYIYIHARKCLKNCKKLLQLYKQEKIEVIFCKIFIIYSILESIYKT